MFSVHHLAMEIMGVLGSSGQSWEFRSYFCGFGHTQHYKAQQNTNSTPTATDFQSHKSQQELHIPVFLPSSLYYTTEQTTSFLFYKHTDKSVISTHAPRSRSLLAPHTPQERTAFSCTQTEQTCRLLYSTVQVPLPKHNKYMHAHFNRLRRITCKEICLRSFYMIKSSYQKDKKYLCELPLFNDIE